MAPRILVKFIVLAASIGVTGGCAASADDTAAAATASGHHPHPAFVRDANVPASEWRLADRTGELPVAPVAASHLVLGVADQPEEQVFGDVSDVAILADGRLAILDALSHDLRIFSPDGDLLQRLGGEGSGPGELRRPRAMVVTPNGDIIVSDMQRRLTRFAGNEDGYSFAEAIPLELSIRDLCYLGDELMVHAVSLADSFVVRRVGPGGQVEQSFGTLYASPNVLVNMMMAEGRIACDEEAGFIYYAPDGLMGEVRAYRADGTVAWRAVARDFVTNQMVDTPDGGYSVAPSPTGVHSLQALEVVPGRGVLVQYSYLTQEELKAREPARVYVTALLSRDGSVVASAGEHWPIVGALHDEMLAGISHLPYPQVSLFRLRGGERP